MDKSYQIEEVINLLKQQDRDDEIVQRIRNQLLQVPGFTQLCDQYSEETTFQLCKRICYQKYDDQETIFEKQDKNAKFMLVLSGEIHLLGGIGFIQALGPGEYYGETRSQQSYLRQITAIAIGITQILYIHATEFKTIIQRYMRKLIQDKLDFIKIAIPDAKLLPFSQLEKLAYTFKTEVHHKGQVVFQKGKDANCLWFVGAGEWYIRDEKHYEKYGALKELMSLQVGCWFGEEGVFYDQKMPFWVIAASDEVKIYRISKESIQFMFTDDMLIQLKRVFKAKSGIQNSVSKIRGKAQGTLPLDVAVNPFPMATSVALQRFLSQIRREKLRNSPRPVSTGKINTKVNFQSTAPVKTVDVLVPSLTFDATTENAIEEDPAAETQATFFLTQKENFSRARSRRSRTMTRMHINSPVAWDRSRPQVAIRNSPESIRIRETPIKRTYTPSAEVNRLRRKSLSPLPGPRVPNVPLV